jgi:carboxyl-terminal processing protease
VKDRSSFRNTLTVVMISLIAFAAGTLAGEQLHRGDKWRWIVQIAQLVPGAYTYDEAETIPAPMDLRPVSTFWEARKELKRRFYRTIDDEAELTYGAIRGMLEALGDPYTRLMEPEEFQAFQKENEGNFEGIGAVLEVREKEADNGEVEQEVIVQSVIFDGPAEKRGLLPGDVIIGVDDTPIRGLRLDQVVDRIRGPQGTTVKLTVTREGKEEPVDVPIVRDRIEYPVVEYEMKPGQIGYVWLRQFSRPATVKMRAALRELVEKQKAKGLVFDLSSNGGGLLDTAVEVEGLFFDGGPAAFILEKGAEEPEVLEADDGTLVPPDLPMVCIINSFSASASEIVAGALQDRKRATIVGQPSFGKSKVQTIVQLGDDSAMLVTTALWLTPAKHDVGEEKADGKRGVIPDVAFDPWTPETEVSGTEWHEQQVEKALQVLSKQMADAGLSREAGRPSLQPGT